MNLAAEKPPMRRRTLGLKTTLAGVALLAVGASAAIVHFPWLIASRRNINEVVEQLNEAIATSTSQEVKHLFDSVNSTQEAIKLAITRDLIDINNAKQREALFLSLLQANPTFTFVQFAYPNGDYIGAQRVRNRGDDRQNYIFNLHFRRWNPQKQVAIKTTDVYIPFGASLQRVDRQQIEEPGWYAPLRPWYQDAVRTPGKPAWTVYVYRSTNTPGVDSNVTLQDGNRFVGVIGIGFELNQVSNYLSEQYQGKQTGTVFIVNAKGDLIASTDLNEGTPTQRPGQDLPQLKRLQEAQNPYLQTASRAIGDAQIDLAQIRSRQQFTVLDPQTGEKYYISLAPLKKLDWMVGTVIPESIFLDRINANLRLLLFAVGGFVVAVAAAVYALAERAIARPILKLQAAAASVAGGDLSVRVPDLGTHELDMLAQAFNYMTGQLQLSNEQLAEYSRTLEQKVEQRTGELKAVLDNIVDGLAVIDVSNRITQCNPALLDMLGRDRGEVDGRSCTEVFPSDVVDIVAASRASTTQVFASEIPLTRDRLGKVVATSIHTSQQDLATDKILGTILLIRDITVEKQVDRMKTDFVSSVSHELRTPLTSVLGFAKLIQKKLDDTIFPLVQSDDKKIQRAVKQVAENVGIIISEGTRLTKLINDVLDIAKMEAGKIDWHMEPLTVEEIVDRALSATSALFETKGITPIRDVAADLPPTIGDKDRLIQVVINLISNAVKFQDRGSITCRARREGDVLRISVIDQGIGIAAEDIPKVFEKFKQVGDTLTNKPQGTGLGLPISKEIVEHHGGMLWAESEVGKGSTFYFTLPIVAPPTEETAPSNQIEPAVAADPVRDAIAVAGKSILVVDDDANLRQLLRQELEQRGYHVREADCGTEAIAQIRAQPPNLVMLDIMMPQMSGFDVAVVLKNDPTLAHVPILILSGLEERARAASLSVEGFLTKPVDGDVLAREVERVLQQAKSQPSPAAPIPAHALLRQLQLPVPDGGTLRSVKTILVVDDDENTRKLLRQLLEPHGYSIREADTVAAAQIAVRQEIPDLIALDLLLPDAHGYDLAAQFKRDPLTASIPIVIISVTDDRDRGMRLGVERYFQKPFDTDSLRHEIDGLLSQPQSPRAALVADDRPDTVAALAAVLQSKGYRVVTAQTGEELLAKGRVSQPDVTIASVKFAEQVRALQAMAGMEGMLALSLAADAE